MNNQIIGHIAGSSGSGKTYIGELIQQKFPSIIVKDLDDFNDEIQHSEKFKNMDDNLKIEYYKNKFKKLLNIFIIENPQKILFVGYNSNWNSWINIETNNKLFIKILTENIIKQKYDRDSQFKFISENDIMNWKKSINNDIIEYKQNNYKFMSSKKIYDFLLKII